MINDKFENVDDADIPGDSSANIDITWSSNEPTAAITQTIADGASPTVAETGQYIQNINTEVDKLRVQVAALRAQIGS